MIEGVEHLTLDRVKVLEAKQLLVGRVLEGRDRKWLEVEELGVRWVELWKDQVLEGDCHDRLRPQPTVRGHTDKVLRGEGLKDWDCEHKILRLSLLHL